MMRFVRPPRQIAQRGDFSLVAAGFDEKTSAGRSGMAPAPAALAPARAGSGSIASTFGGGSSSGKFEKFGKFPVGPNFVVEPVAGKSNRSEPRGGKVILV